MTLDDIFAEWAKDCVVDKVELDRESLNIPTLHNKYLKMFSMENLRHKKILGEFKELELAKYEYYSGKMCEDDLKTRGWEQFDHKILKPDIPRYLEADKDLVALLLKIDYQKEKVETLKSILGSINGRSFYINNAIKWAQFLQGATI